MIRTAERSDYREIRSMIKVGIAEGTLQPRKKKEIKKAINKGRTLIAEQDGQPVGTVSVDVYSRRIAEVRSLYVKPGHRGNGVAGELVQGILEQSISILPSATIFAISSTPDIFSREGFDTGRKTNTTERHIRMKAI